MGQIALLSSGLVRFEMRPVLRSLSAGIALLLVGGVLVASSASAQVSGCDDLTVGTSEELVTFGPTELGPIAIQLPAGRYRLIATSGDNVHAVGFQPDQINERWSFTLDNGYSSPITPDLPDELITATFDLGVVELEAAASITFVHHGAPPVADSVTATVTFQCSPAPTTTTTTTTSTTTTTTTTTTPTTTEAPPVTNGGSVSPTTIVAETSEVRSTEAPTSTVGVTGGENLPRTGSDESVLWFGLLLLTAGGALIVVSKILTVEAQRAG